MICACDDKRYICVIKITYNITAMVNEDNMNNELEALATMAEAEACKLYNVDYKDEAIQYIVDYWTCIA